MRKINNESFNKLLKDKYGIEWMNSLNSYMYLDEFKATWSCKRIGLIGAMLVELLDNKNIMFGLHQIDSGTRVFYDMKSDKIPLYGEQACDDVYDSLIKAVEAVEW